MDNNATTMHPINPFFTLDKNRFGSHMRQQHTSSFLLFVLKKTDSALAHATVDDAVVFRRAVRPLLQSTVRRGITFELMSVSPEGGGGMGKERRDRRNTGKDTETEEREREGENRDMAVKSGRGWPAR